MIDFPKRCELALCISLVFSSLWAVPSAGDDLLAFFKEGSKDVTAMQKDSYTINFNNVSMLELLRFASKLTNLNFIFDEADVQFTVSLISEEPVTAKNVIAALAQVLRIHDLILLQQDGNVIITRSSKVNQVAPIISSDLSEGPPANALLVTRVFRLKNANVTTIAGIIRPMMSDSALIEISMETRQLIVTDIATNVEQIASLLLSLDSPHSPLDIESYVVKHVAPDELIHLTQQILSPFAEGNPLTFVPQKETNSIFIVSTPHLIERALIVMEDLDVPEKNEVVGKTAPLQKNVFVYQVKHRTLEEITEELKKILAQMQTGVARQPALEKAIEGVEQAKETHSLIFIADEATISQLKLLLSSIDTENTFNPITAKGGVIKSTFLLYTPQYRSGEELYEYMQDITKNLKESGLGNFPLLQALATMKWSGTTHALLFTGDPQSLERINGILTSIDAPISVNSKTTEVFIYKPQFVSHQQIQRSLQALIPSLEATRNQADQVLIKTIRSLQWNPDTQTLSVATDQATAQRLKTLLSSLDNPQEQASPLSQGFFLYKLLNVKGDQVIQDLKKAAAKIPPSTLRNSNFIAAVNNLEWISSKNAILITGTAEAIDQVKAWIAEFDVSHTGGASPAEDFYIYDPKHLTPEDILAILKVFAKDMHTAGLHDPDLLLTLETATHVERTNSVLLTGSKESLEKVKTLLASVDTATSTVQTVGPTTFYLYKLQSASPEKFISGMKTFGKHLPSSSPTDRELIEAIESMKYIKENNSILFHGTAQALKRIQELASQFDSSEGVAPVPTREVSTFVIYTPKYIQGEELIAIMHDFMNNLIASGVSNPALFDTINNLKWIPKTSSLLISGEEDSIKQVEGLLQKFDIPGQNTPSIETIENTSFLVYKLQYHTGVEIQSALKQIAANLAKASTPNVALAESIDSLQWIQPTNSLIATGHQDVLVKLKELVQNIDVPLRQVFIEVLVIQTALTNTQNFGLQWGGQMQYLNKTLFQTGNFPTLANATNGASGLPFLSTPLQGINATSTPNNTTLPFSTGFDLGVIGDIIMHKGQSFISLGSLLNAIQLDNDVTIVINQKIITQDNRQSTIFVGTNVPYTGSLVTNITANTTTTANIEYRDVGVNLTITPILGENDVITLDVVQDLSAIVGSIANLQTTAVSGIVTNHSHMETRVSVPDAKFLVLSGVIQDNKQHFRTAIPCLGSLPVVGALFSENDRTDGKQNIIIFMRPKIVNSIEEYKQITEHQEWLYKDQARLPVLKEEFDEGLDMVKQPEDE